MAKTKLIIHLGHPKTATSYLQTHVFDKHPDINNLGKPKKKWLLYLRLLLEEKEVNHSEIKKITDDLKIKRDKINLISDEGFLTPFSPKSDTPKFLKRVVNIFLNIENIDEIIFLFTIRRQTNLILSQYARGLYHFEKVYKKFSDIKEIGRYFECEGDYPEEVINLFDTFKHHKVFTHLKNYANKSNSSVRILVYEQFEKDQESFLKELSEIIGVDSKITTELAKTDHGLNEEHTTINISKKDILGQYYVKDPRSFGSAQPIIFDLFSQILRPYELIRNFPRKYLVLKKKLSYSSAVNPFYTKKHHVDRFVKFTKSNEIDIQDFYRKDNELLNNELTVDLQEYGYFNSTE